MVEIPLSVAAADPKFNYRWADYKFLARCPRCSFDGAFHHVDRKVGEKEACIIKRWNPHDMELLWDPFTDRCQYVWKIPEDYKKLIREGRLWALEHAPWEVVECIKANKHLLFEDGVVLHGKEEALAGFRNRGWGISRILSNFRQTFYVQVLRRYNEAIALDYVIPFRVITPEPGDKNSGGQAGDPLLNFSLGNFTGQVRNMVRRRRKDPAAINVLPFPLKYQLLGGEARQLAPTDLLNQAMEVQLNNIGIPADLWKGSLTTQAAPVALRLFETSWSWLPHSYARTLRFLVEGIARILSWEKPEVQLEPVTHADDITAIQAKLQLMLGGQISPSTALKGVRVKYRDEVDRTIEDQRYQAEAQAKMQAEQGAVAEMEQMVQSAGGQQGQPGQQGGGAGQGQQAGQPGPAQMSADQLISGLVVGDNEKISPQEMWERADTVAQQLLGMDASQRNSTLRKIKQSNPNIHPFVLKRLEELRAEAARQGQSQVLQQNFGGGGQQQQQPGG
jgi:hypothetical protein